MLSGKGFVKIKNAIGNADESVRIGQKVSDRIRTANGFRVPAGGLPGCNDIYIYGTAERAHFALRSRECRGSGYDIDPKLLCSTRLAPSDALDGHRCEGPLRLPSRLLWRDAHLVAPGVAAFE